MATLTNAGSATAVVTAPATVVAAMSELELNVETPTGTTGGVDTGVNAVTPTSVAAEKTPLLLLPVMTRNDVSDHFDFDDCYIIIDKIVYDVTAFVHNHPGGMDVIMEFAGTCAVGL